MLFSRGSFLAGERLAFRFVFGQYPDVAEERFDCRLLALDITFYLTLRDLVAICNFRAAKGVLVPKHAVDPDNALELTHPVSSIVHHDLDRKGKSIQMANGTVMASVGPDTRQAVGFGRHGGQLPSRSPPGG